MRLTWILWGVRFINDVIFFFFPPDEKHVRKSRNDGMTSFLTAPFPSCPADLGEQFQPSGRGLREGDRERGRRPAAARHAVQPGPAVHLHTDRQTGELLIGQMLCPHHSSHRCGALTINYYTHSRVVFLSL